MNDSTTRNICPHSSKGSENHAISTTDLGAHQPYEAKGWVKTVSPNALWRDITPLLQAQNIPAKRYKKRFFKLRHIDQWMFHQLWLNRFSETYYLISPEPITSNDHRKAMGDIFEVLEEKGAEHLIQLYIAVESGMVTPQEVLS
ncbi:hypothetical protein D0962_04115 [Leptolyngbyaceae cyanobacterium CCMR0082]|uniref:Uncharacterized protein n=1 Tax=Adonisia turfae CCMR0082 TaxID=2304604 RepID=A0A6M0S0I9_9CYAN|nr:hypothetical protein [Adonisia turfae]NEZ61965.1 hypothetical protein [Adonisia turfae CCMR0082]